MNRTYKRMGIFELDRRTLKERLQSISDVLRRDGEVHPRIRDDAAYFLRLVANNPKALSALESPKGRPSKADRRADIALDYLVHKKYVGLNKYELAKSHVAHDWATSEKNVEGCWTEFGYYAETRMASLMESNLVDEDDGISNHYTTESRFFGDLSQDLREIHGVSPASSLLK